MAIELDQLNSCSVPFYGDVFTTQVYERNILLEKMREKGHVVYGTEFRLPIRWRELSQAKSVDPDDARATVHVETRSAAQVQRKYAVCDTVVTWEERVTNKSDAQMAALARDKMKEGAQDLEELISDQLYQTLAQTGGTDITGFYSIIRDPSTASTYAGISSADISTWVAGTYYTSAVVLALYGSYSLEAGMRACWFETQPDLIVTSKTLVGVYASKLQPGERRKPEGGKAGATDLYFQGSPVVNDAHCGDTNILFLNTNHLWLGHDADFNFTMAPWESDPDRLNAFRALASFSGNLMCDCRQTQGSYTNVT